MKVRKLPLVIDVVQYLSYDNDNDTLSFGEAVPDWLSDELELGNVSVSGMFSDQIEVLTEEGIMRGAPGCYVVKGAADELYIIKQDIFEKTYEIVS